MEAPEKKPGGEERSHPDDAMQETPADSAMDTYLRSQGLYRKRVAKDGSCLFRAVAEQVFYSQSQHIAIRKACINYLRKHREKFEAFIEGPFEEYLKNLQNPQEWVGQVEISALSLMYKKEFVIYQEPNSTPSHVTENGFPDKVLLCFSNGSHYDIVYPIEYTQNAALCQSILYELLYERVFDTDVSKIVEELNPPEVNKDGSRNSDESGAEDENLETEMTATSNVNDLKSHVRQKQHHKNGKPDSVMLSGKVLRSLNPSVYQNTEYEVWQQSKRDQQKQDFSIAAGMQYSVGDKCKVRLDATGRFYNAHIQEVQSTDGPAIVFVEELGARHSVLLKNLKPLPQASPPVESWSTVSGKKIKKPSPVHGQTVQADADCRGSKNPNKSIKSPRFMGSRHHQTSYPGMHSQQASSENKTVGKNSSQTVRKAERERTEDLDHTNRDCSYFGLSPEERREKQAIEETRSLYEIQYRDEEAFPALSSPSVSQVATQTTYNHGKRKLTAPNERKKSNSPTEENDDRQDVKEEKVLSSRQIPLDQTFEAKTSENSEADATGLGELPPSSHGDTQSPSVEQTLPDSLPDVHPPSTAFSEMHLPPTVPSVPALMPAWPNEPTTYGRTGVPSQIPVSSMMPTATTGLDPPLSPASPVAGIPVSLQAVNQPLMPIAQALNPYQDPLYPGFPLNEKGERVVLPPYSLCSAGEDLPQDKNILRFFFNLGIKAYSCPMWAPHSYLYPLHQACLTACRMYPKVPVPVYPHNPWLQEVPLVLNGSEAANPGGCFPLQSEVRLNGQSPQSDSISPVVPLYMPAAQVSESQGLVCVKSEAPAQAVQAEYEPLGGKGLFPQPPCGQNPFLGPLPVAPLFPHLWYGYPLQQGYVENSVARQVVVPIEDKGAAVYLPKACRSPTPTPAGCVEESVQKTEHCVQGLPLPATIAKNECNTLNKTSTSVPRANPTGIAAPPTTQAKPVFHNPSSDTQAFKRKTVTPPVNELAKSELKSATLSHKEQTDNESTGLEECRVQRPREESSEDEWEVSNMLRSGRSKQFYNQMYGGGRRPRGDWSYPPGRGGYHFSRHEESWKGPPSRNRDEGYQYHRNFRGRPYRNDRRRGNFGDGNRGPQSC